MTALTLAGCGGSDQGETTVEVSHAAALGQEVIELWQGPPPEAQPLDLPETQVINDKTWRPILEVHNVSKPSLTVIRPDAGKANGSAMVVLPGGAFGVLAWDIEGTEVGEFLAKHGITAFVLKYRVRDPSLMQGLEFLLKFFLDRSRLGELLGPRRDVAVIDAMQAMRVLRVNAAGYGIDPSRIGMMGFSAGAITTIAVLQRADDTTRPDVAAAIYGMAFEPAVPVKASPLLMVVAKDDPIMAEASTEINKVWQAAGKSSELHVLESGGHGFGLGRAGTDSVRFPELLEAWLRSHGYIKSES